MIIYDGLDVLVCLYFSPSGVVSRHSFWIYIDDLPIPFVLKKQALFVFSNDLQQRWVSAFRTHGASGFYIGFYGNRKAYMYTAGFKNTCIDLAWLMIHELQKDMMPIPALPHFTCQDCTSWHSWGSPESSQLHLRLTLGCPNCKKIGL